MTAEAAFAVSNNNMQGGRALSAILVCLVLAGCRPDVAELPPISPLSLPSSLETGPVPQTLDEALDMLERRGSGQFHAAMNREDETVPLMMHDGLGRWIRNNWGLYDHGKLYQQLSAMGFRNIDDMSNAILTAYWRRLHHRPLDLESLIQRSQAWERDSIKAAAAMAEQEKKIAARMSAMTLGLRLVPASRPSLRLPPRASDGLRARYLTRYGNGVLIGVRRYPEVDVLQPYYFTTSQGIQPVEIPEMTVKSFVVAEGGKIWAAGVAEGGPMLLRIGKSRDRIDFPRHQLARMGVDDSEHPLAVYEDAVFRWNGERWTLVRDKLKLPETVMPPRIVGSTLLLRDEGHGENDKRLWWTEVTSDEPLIAHDQALGFGWFDALSYQFTRAGEFWFSTGNSAFPGWTLVRRLKSGEFRLAIVNGQTRFLGSKETKPAVSITAIKELSNGQLVGVGDLGFYRIEDNQITTLVRFRDSSQITADNLDWRWDPADLLELSPRKYIIGGLFGGIYLLDLSADEYRLIELDERIGAPTEL